MDPCFSVAVMIVASVSGIRGRGRVHLGGVVERLLGKLNGLSPHIPLRRGAVRRNAAIGAHRGDGTVRDRH